MADALELTLRVARDAARRSPRVQGQRMSPSERRLYAEQIRGALARHPTATLGELQLAAPGCPAKVICEVRRLWKKREARRG